MTANSLHITQSNDAENYYYKEHTKSVGSQFLILLSQKCCWNTNSHTTVVTVIAKVMKL